MFMLLVLIVAIAAFNIVSAQTMLVNEKRTDIAILRTMGASEGLVLRLVLVQGILVAVAGIGFGLILGLLLAQQRHRDGFAAGIADRCAAARRHLFRHGAVVGVAVRHRADRGSVLYVLRVVGVAPGAPGGGAESGRSAARSGSDRSR